jgi:RimJ/RimL family protein N-acetyltransferase
MPVQFIPRDERRQQQELIRSIAAAVYGTADKCAFMEEFLPQGGRHSGAAPEAKAQRFAGSLTASPHPLWAVTHQDTPVGFIMIVDLPGLHIDGLGECGRNNLGFGLSLDVARHGIMTNALREVLASGQLTLPVRASTSQRNTPALRLLDGLGFRRIGATYFMGEPSYCYQFPGH